MNWEESFEGWKAKPTSNEIHACPLHLGISRSTTSASRKLAGYSQTCHHAWFQLTLLLVDQARRLGSHFTHGVVVNNELSHHGRGHTRTLSGKLSAATMAWRFYDGLWIAHDEASVWEGVRGGVCKINELSEMRYRSDNAAVPYRTVLLYAYDLLYPSANTGSVFWKKHAWGIVHPALTHSLAVPSMGQVFPSPEVSTAICICV